MKTPRTLFEVAPADFTAARNALVRELREAGKADEAKQVGSLRKPPATLWIANQLGPRHEPAMRKLLEATRALTRAQTGGHGDLREAMQGQREALQKAMEAVPALAKEIDARVTPELLRRVQTTLQSAATADPDALLEGTLEHELEATGFGELLGKVSSSPPPSPAAPHKSRAGAGATAARDKAAEAAARRARAEHQRALKRAEHDARTLDAHASAAEEKAAKAQATADDLRKSADTARARANEAAAKALSLRSKSP
jgi:hypothetical protein